MKITVMGAGAMGGLYGAYLSRVPGHQVHLLDIWPEHIDAMNSGGLKIKEGEEDIIFPVKASGAAEEIGVSDIVIVFVKSVSTAQAMEGNKELFDEKTITISLQNGYGNAEDISKFVPRDNIIIGTTGHGANVLGPGRIEHAGAGVTVIGGLTRSAAGHVPSVSALFGQAGFEVRISDDAMKAVWHKLFVNIGCNALASLLDVKNGALLRSGPALSLIEEVVHEAVEVANAAGMDFDKAQELENVKLIIERTAENRNSMLQDVLNKRKTEIDKINGSIVNLGEELGVETPVNRTLALLIRAREACY